MLIVIGSRVDTQHRKANPLDNFSNPEPNQITRLYNSYIKI